MHHNPDNSAPNNKTQQLKTLRDDFVCPAYFDVERGRRGDKLCKR